MYNWHLADGKNVAVFSSNKIIDNRPRISMGYWLNKPHEMLEEGERLNKRFSSVIPTFQVFYCASKP